MEVGFVPPAWQGIMWGILPIGSSFLAILAIVLLPERKRRAGPIEVPAASPEPLYAQGAK
jgi:hypothetical protein